MTQQRSFAARFVAGAAGTMLLSAAALLGTPAAASAASVAAVQQGYGYAVTPAQPYLHNPDAADWTGSYLVGGKQVWCIRFAYLAPDANQQYQPGQTLLTKWGTPVDPTTAAEISYLLLRYGTTTSNDDAAALAHLLHSWTSSRGQRQWPDRCAGSGAGAAELRLAEPRAGLNWVGQDHSVRVARDSSDCVILGGNKHVDPKERRHARGRDRGHRPFADRPSRKGLPG